MNAAMAASPTTTGATISAIVVPLMPLLLPEEEEAGTGVADGDGEVDGDDGEERGPVVAPGTVTIVVWVATLKCSEGSAEEDLGESLKVAGAEDWTIVFVTPRGSARMV